MAEHLPECPLLEPCSADTPNHGFCSRQNTICIHCERQCICDRLRACEERVEESMDRAWAKAAVEIEAHARSLALDAAREAVKGVNWFNDEGKMLSAIVATADSIAAIDALKEQR